MNNVERTDVNMEELKMKINIPTMKLNRNRRVYHPVFLKTLSKTNKNKIRKRNILKAINMISKSNKIYHHMLNMWTPPVIRANVDFDLNDKSINHIKIKSLDIDHSSGDIIANLEKE